MTQCRQGTQCSAAGHESAVRFTVSAKPQRGQLRCLNLEAWMHDHPAGPGRSSATSNEDILKHIETIEKSNPAVSNVVLPVSQTIPNRGLLLGLPHTKWSSLVFSSHLFASPAGLQPLTAPKVFGPHTSIAPHAAKTQALRRFFGVFFWSAVSRFFCAKKHGEYHDVPNSSGLNMEVYPLQ